MALDWRRVLVFTHRWLGITGSLLFISWFASGIVMMYARMPRLTPEERLMRAPVLDLRSARIDPSSVARLQAQGPQRLRVGMLRDRPVYRFSDGVRWTTVFADSGDTLSALTTQQATDLARAFAPEHAATLRYDGRVEEPDQWTLQVRGLLPAARVAMGDSDDTYLYVSEQTGEPILETTRRSRRWGYLGAVFHWIYFTPVRRNSAAWAQLIIGTSIAGSFLCLSGLFWGLWQFSSSARYRLRGLPSRSPYTGLMKWHHYAGLVFGLVTFTWVFSGLLSMDPWDWSPGTAPTRAQRDALSGGPISFDSLALSDVKAAAAALATAFPIKEIEILKFRGELVGEAFRSSTTRAELQQALGDPAAVIAQRVPLDHRLVMMRAHERGLFSQFETRAIEAAAADAMPGVTIVDATWLTDYDSYYYGRARCESAPCVAPTLPVLRVRYGDDAATWLYFDPARGVIARKEERLSRLNRWLYHGLHSLDFPWLYYRRPLWDIVMIALSVGGLVVSSSSMPAAIRRLQRHLQRKARPS